ncbi:MAG TPA: threonine/serine dehydratase [Actinophytocola sp.]|jgi:threonine dehydratase|nr:threonine/serine dehydratase [Actinophytocola sp.]
MSKTTFDSVSAAELARRSRAVAPAVAEHLTVTPLRRFAALSDELGADLLVKCEHLQRTGSFKPRGALAKLLTLTAGERERGVVTASTGNHGLGVANALAALGGSGHVFVPDTAEPTKVAALERFGVRVHPRAAEAGAVELMAREYADERGLAYVSPYNDADVIAGQGTIGVELLEQAGTGLDALVVAVGGGGLVSGIAAVLKEELPGVRIIGASPENDPAMAVSVEKGRIVSVEGRPTLSDGTAGNVEPGSITLDLCRSLVDEWVLVPEPDIGAALRAVVDTEHELVEGSAAVAFAAARACAPRFAGGRVGVISCGRNISSAALVRALSA